MINLFLSGSNIFVWNAEDVITLRKEYRIVGSLVGTCPKKKLHAQRNWLPLLLMKEESKLLIDKGIAQLVRSPEKITDPSVIESYYTQRDKLCEEQIILMKEKRKRQIMENADEIYEGKKRKYEESLKTQMQEKTSEVISVAEIPSEEKNSPSAHIDNLVDNKSDIECSKMSNKKDEEIKESLTIPCDDASEIKRSITDNNNSSVEVNQEKMDSIALKGNESLVKDGNSDFLSKEVVIAAEIAKVTEVDKKLCMVQIFSECPWRITSDIVNLEYPCTEMEKLRYEVFKDLWEKSYYITGGMKFGGDFLVYKGDPLKYHAVFIVVCIPRSRKMTGFDIITHGRLGKQVKKIVAFAQIDANGVLQYCCTTFAGDMK